MLRFLIYVILAFIVWKLVRIVLTTKKFRETSPDPKIEFPADQSYKNIEDADFEDITPKSDPPS